ncbi:MAG: VCBS repeat-containing protein, partial [Acidobacteria bacterium]|nr:VCBS repeat-containing protein [Acidobacteriota bacterium]
AKPLDGSTPPELTRLFSAPGVDLAAMLPVRGAGAERGQLSLPGVGLMRHFSPRTQASGWGLARRRPLATRASRHQYGLRLTTPRSTLLRLAEGDLYAIGPESVDPRRLRSALLPAEDGGAAREIWSRLPGPERVQSSWFDVLDGRPVLIVATNSADKIGILERQQLRLFSLYGDRTRAGVGPWLTAGTTSRRWQRVEPIVVDVDGDGDDDLVVVQVDGLGSGKIKLEAFLNTGSRSFAAKTRSTVLDQPPAGWHFGSDLTGDGLADLVLLSQGSLSVYPTLGQDPRRLLAKRPRWTFDGADIPRVEHSVEIGSGGVVVNDARPSKSGQPVVLDLDGDGRGELLVAENPQWGFGRLRVVFLPSP